MSPPVIACAPVAGAAGCEPAAAALGVALAQRGDAATSPDGAALVVVVGGEGRRGPTMLAAEAARELEAGLRDDGLEASARGSLAWVAVARESRDEAAGAVALALSHGVPTVLSLPEGIWNAALADPSLAVTAALLRADLPAQRTLCALAVREAHEAGLRVRVLGRAPGRIAGRRALAGLDPGGESGRRAAVIARRLEPGRSPEPSQAGQAMPLVLGAVLLLCFCTLLLATLGGAVTGVSRAQLVADLSALSAARSMREDFDRLFVASELRGGAPNPLHLSRAEYLSRARAAALEAARRNETDPARLELEFPEDDSFAPLRVRVRVVAELAAEGAEPVSAWALAEAIPGGADHGDDGASVATGGGYAGPLAHRQGTPMRPDVAIAFDRMAAAARAEGVALAINSGFRSDAEQAELWEANPDPRWVAPPGTSLHRCATELDLGPPSAYAWLTANARRFGFLRRYSWEPWHFGYVEGPAPCSDAGERVGSGAATAAGDGEASATSLPSFVPARFRTPILDAATRWNVSAALLAAQLMAESNFNPFAVSPAGAAGIAQFMPGTASAYGLGDPFDPAAAIDAQAHLMSDLLEQFDGREDLALAAYNAGPGAVEPCWCVPGYPETQGYVARILGLLEGTGEIVAPALEVRLVR